MLRLDVTNRFKKDLDKAISRGCNYSDLENVLNYLVIQKPLPKKYKDHKLKDTSKYKNVRECHINPDWLLIYQVESNNLILRLLRTGTHSDLFK